MVRWFVSDNDMTSSNSYVRVIFEIFDAYEFKNYTRVNLGENCWNFSHARASIVYMVTRSHA